MWRVYVPTKLRKDVRRRFPANDRQRIIDALRDLEQDGTYAKDVVHLLGDQYRRREGAYRILFRATEALRFIQVQGIERRTSTTYRKRRS